MKFLGKIGKDEKFFGGFLGRLSGEERDEQLARFTLRVAGKRIIGNDGAEFGGRAQNDFWTASKFPLDGLLDASGDQLLVRFAGFEDHVAALDIGFRIIKL